MSDVFDYHRGPTSLLVTMSHSGTNIPRPIFQCLSERAKSLQDTDWHVPRLYDFVRDMGASVLSANFSRYVVDLNRPPGDESLYPGQPTTGLCPTTLFDGTPLYADGQSLGEDEIASRLERYWRPYHDKIAEELARIKKAHGYALLYDAHSIASSVPRLFEGCLPDLNLGTAWGQSCRHDSQAAIVRVIDASEFSSTVNGRFVGGYVIRRYGRPADHVHAVQMEIAQRSYMEEIVGFPYTEIKARKLKPVLRDVLASFLEAKG